MSWLEDTEYDFEFDCECGEYYQSRKKEKPEPPVCAVCSKPMNYLGFIPMRMGGITKVEYEKNGVKAWRIVDSEGNTRHVAKAAEEYYNTAKVNEKMLSSRALVSSARKGDSDEV